MDIPASYDPDLYVPQKEAQQWLLGAVKSWKARQSRMANPVLILSGELGLGKTWFLRHVSGHERRVSPRSVYLDLERRSVSATPEVYVRAIGERVRKQNGAAPGILFLDHVPPQLDEHLRALEETILRPQLANCGSLAVMALTHPSHVCWRTPSLRSGERWTLAPFSGERTGDQVRRLARASLVSQAGKAATIHRYSGGLPLLSYLLATHDRPQAFLLLLDCWLSSLPAGERECVQSYLEAVCLLDVLEHAAIRRALVVHQRHCPNAPGYPVHPIGLRNVLQKYWLAQPSPEAPGRIVLLASVRRAARELLKARDGELYAGLEAASREVPGRQE